MSLKLFLNPGDWWFGACQPGEISTILGSCVSVVIVNTKAQVLGVSHAIMPQNSKNEALHGRFSQDVVHIFWQKLQLLGLNTADCQVGLFGGGVLCAPHAGNRVPSVPGAVRSLSIGEKNVEISRQTLASCGLQPGQIDTGGCYYRRLQVSLPDGSVLLQKYPLQNLAMQQVRSERTSVWPKKYE
jgi:chemotaxis protein CheD